MMNAQKMTQKSLEAVQAAQSLAVEYQHQAVAPAHLLCALLQQEDGLIGQLVRKMGSEPGNMAAALAKKLSEMPRVTGSGREADKVYITPELDRALTAAEKEAASTCLPAPRACPVFTWPPIFGRAASPLESHIYIPAAPTEATALLPIRPIHSMSVRL